MRPRDQDGQTAPAELNAQCASDPRLGESGLRGGGRRTPRAVAVFTVRTVAVAAVKVSLVTFDMTADLDLHRPP